LVGFERKGHGLARRFVERFEKGSGGVPHTPSGIGLRRGRRLAGALRNRFAQVLGQQDRSGDAQTEMPSVHGTSRYILNDARSISLMRARVNGYGRNIAFSLNPRKRRSDE
jgi:hypothetical protein